MRSSKPTNKPQSEAPSVDTTSLEQKITKLTLEIASKQKVISRLKSGINVCQDCGRILTRCENCERLWQT